MFGWDGSREVGRFGFECWGCRNCYGFGFFFCRMVFIFEDVV